MEKQMRGDVVCVKTKKGKVDCAVVSTRYVSRGRWAGETEYLLAPLEGPVGKAYGFRTVGERWFSAAKKTWTDAEVRAALAVYDVARQDVEEKKEVRDEERKCQLAQLAPKVGDEVLIRFSDCPRWKRVEAVNEQTGKVGIAANSYQRKLAAASGARTVAALAGRPDMAERIRDPRKYRWIDPRHIVQVRPASQQAVL